MRNTNLARVNQEVTLSKNWFEQSNGSHVNLEQMQPEYQAEALKELYTQKLVAKNYSSLNPQR